MSIEFWFDLIVASEKYINCRDGIILNPANAYIDKSGRMLEKFCSLRVKRKETEKMTTKNIEIVSNINLGNWAKIWERLWAKA